MMSEFCFAGRAATIAAAVIVTLAMSLPAWASARCDKIGADKATECVKEHPGASEFCVREGDKARRGCEGGSGGSLGALFGGSGRKEEPSTDNVMQKCIAGTCYKIFAGGSKCSVREGSFGHEEFYPAEKCPKDLYCQYYWTFGASYDFKAGTVGPGVPPGCEPEKAKAKAIEPPEKPKPVAVTPAPAPPPPALDAIMEEILAPALRDKDYLLAPERRPAPAPTRAPARTTSAPPIPSGVSGRPGSDISGTGKPSPYSGVSGPTDTPTVRPPTVRPPTTVTPTPTVRPPTTVTPTPTVRPPTVVSPTPTVRPPAVATPSPTISEPAPVASAPTISDRTRVYADDPPPAAAAPPEPVASAGPTDGQPRGVKIDVAPTGRVNKGLSDIRDEILRKGKPGS